MSDWLTPGIERVLGAVVLVCGWFLAWVVIDAQQRAATRRLIEDFVRHFPGHCPLCSFHRYGISQGIDVPSDPHDCPEEKKP